MEENVIKLKKNNILKIGIQDENGIATGEHLEFDLEDVEFPFKMMKSQEMHEKNAKDLQLKYKLIEKREDKKGKKILSYNQEDQIREMANFLKKEEEAIDLFIGEGGTKKILNGRSPYYTMFADITEYIEQIMPILENNAVKITDLVKNKYGKKNKEEL